MGADADDLVALDEGEGHGGPRRREDVPQLGPLSIG